MSASASGPRGVYRNTTHGRIVIKSKDLICRRVCHIQLDVVVVLRYRKRIRACGGIIGVIAIPIHRPVFARAICSKVSAARVTARVIVHRNHQVLADIAVVERRA